MEHLYTDIEMLENEVMIENEALIREIRKEIIAHPIDVKFKKLHPDAKIPFYAHDGDVGMDMTAISVEYNEELDMYIYHTGLAFESDFNYGQLLFPRSSNRKTDAYLCNSVGIADSAIYRGEILFCYKNRDSIDTIANKLGMEEYFHYLLTNDSDDANLKLYNAAALYEQTVFLTKENAKKLAYAPYNVGDKIGQMVFVQYPQVNLTECLELSTSVRGENGFGSTGN